MKSAGALLQSVLREAAQRTLALDPDAGPVDNCSCVKDEGMRGSGGWHLVVVDDRWIALVVARSQDPEKTRAELEGYRGKELAAEPCPAYRAAVRRRVAEER